MTTVEQAIIQAIKEGNTTARSITRETQLDKYLVGDTLANLTKAGVVEWLEWLPRHQEFAIVEGAECAE